VSACIQQPHPLPRFVIPLAIGIGSLSIATSIRWSSGPETRLPNAQVQSAANAINDARTRAQLSQEQQLIDQEQGPVEPVERVEDLPVTPFTAVRKLSTGELTPELVRRAAALLLSRLPPLGTEIPLEVHGRMYIARVETHFHEIGGPKRPWGYHRGMTLYWAE
jgi:hypothetical protein